MSALAGTEGMNAPSPAQSAIEDQDAPLLVRIADGDASAFRALVNRHADRLLGFAQRLVGDLALAEDIVQDSFLAVWRTAPSWSPKAKVSTWLYRITRNKALDHLRKRRPTVDPDDVVLVDGSDGADRTIDRRQTGNTVRAALDALPERQRAAIVLVHYELLSGAEASDALEISVEALESLLARGRRALRAALAEQRDDLMGDLT